MTGQLETQTPFIVPVILCGGSGTRLWPASREQQPKQFLSLIDDQSLLQNTLRRAMRATAVKASSVVTVTLADLKDEVVRQLSEISPDAAIHVLSEPSARNTAAAVAFAAEYVCRTFGESAIMWILPSDHHIGDEIALYTALQQAVISAQDGNLVTFGINPTRPDTGYGYIRAGNAADGSASLPVEQFVEKPNLETAQTYLADGGYLWNSGMFIFSAKTVLDEFAAHAPTVLADTRTAMAYSQTAPEADAYGRIAKHPFDKAIMEKSSRVRVVPCNPSWSDIGTWESLWDIREKDKNNNAISGRAACYKATGCLIQGAGEKLIAVAGLDDIVVIETDDALLVAKKSDSDSMKSLTEALKASGAREAVSAALPAQTSPVAQPWKMVAKLPAEESVKTQELSLQPNEKQSFDRRPEGLCLVTVLDGAATLHINGKEKTLAALHSVRINAADYFTIANNGMGKLNVLITQKADANVIDFAARKVA